MLNLIYSLFVKVIGQISPDIRAYIKEFLTMLEKKAKETDNPIDDIFVVILRIIFGF